MILAVYRKMEKFALTVLDFFCTTPALNFSVLQYYRSEGEAFSFIKCASDLGISVARVWQCYRILKKNGLLAPQASFESLELCSSKSGKIYFRTIFYAPLEFRYIKMNLYESYPYIDKFIIVEGNRTHVGEEKDFIFSQYLEKIPSNLRDKVLYVPADLSSRTVDCALSKDGVQLHKNEAELWSVFEQYVDLHENDVVLATDADEIIYRHMYPIILNKLQPNAAFHLPLNQFFYRMNYFWENLTFWAPTAAFVGYYRSRPYPHRWRYDGRRFPFIAGCHFSWQLTLDEMLYKLKTYSHADIYGHFADKEVLRDAVTRKIYPFEPNEPFTIKELDPDKDRAYYPESFYAFREDFSHLLPPAPIQ